MSVDATTIYRLADMTIHPDWYRDGAEWSIGDETEELWRLDFKVGDNWFQAQLFATCVSDERYEEYTGFRLFLERDNRDESGEKRIDYACDGWDITSDLALFLLALSRDAVKVALEEDCDRVAALPCHIPTMADWAE